MLISQVFKLIWRTPMSHNSHTWIALIAAIPLDPVQ
jgi:hypothetical protein